MKICRYISSGKLFFGVQILSVKPSANGFFVFLTDIATEWGITDEGKADGCNPSVGDEVGKKITDELLITHRRNMVVGKTVKSCSGKAKNMLSIYKIKGSTRIEMML
jgi:hypothetical protein